MDLTEVILTERQEQALTLVGQGCSTIEVAKGLGVTPRTAKHYVDLLRGKFGVKTKRELIPIAQARKGFA